MKNRKCKKHGYWFNYTCPICEERMSLFNDKHIEAFDKAFKGFPILSGDCFEAYNSGHAWRIKAINQARTMSHMRSKL